MKHRRKFGNGILAVYHMEMPDHEPYRIYIADETADEEWIRQYVSPAASEYPLSMSNLPPTGYDITPSSTPEYYKKAPKFGGFCRYCYGKSLNPNLPEDGSDMRIASTNNTGIYNFDGSEKEIDFWVYPEDDSGGWLLRFMKNDTEPFLEVKRTANKNIEVKDSTKTVTLSGVLPTGDWHHFRISFNAGAKGNVAAYVDGQSIGTGSGLSGVYEDVVQFRLGGLQGWYDEFCMRSVCSSPDEAAVVPTEPYSAITDLNTLGGFGNGAQGSLTVSNDCMINSYAKVTSADGNVIETGSWTEGIFGKPEKGTEVMIHVSRRKTSSPYPFQLPKSNDWPRPAPESYCTGFYAFRRVETVNDTKITLDSPIKEEFDLAELLERYNVQIITVPNFRELTVNAPGTIHPAKYSNDAGGGIIAFRCKGNATVHGKLLASGYGYPRTDWLVNTHGHLIDNFTFCGGGGIFITCGGTFHADKDARIGAEWDGSIGPGEPVFNGRSGNSGAGYGGASAGYQTDTLKVYGNKGKLYNGMTGMCAVGKYPDLFPIVDGVRIMQADNPFYYTYSQGWWLMDKNGLDSISYGGSWGQDAYAYTGNGNFGDNSDAIAALGGTSLILIADRAELAAEAVSTGGQGGVPESRVNGGTGGGGAGFCYIAAREMA